MFPSLFYFKFGKNIEQIHFYSKLNKKIQNKYRKNTKNVFNKNLRKICLTSLRVMLLWMESSIESQLKVWLLIFLKVQIFI